jgi:hypothetical protein
MPAWLRDVRVVSPAVSLPGPLAAALLIVSCGFAGRHGLVPPTRFRAPAIAGTDPVVQFTAILDATRKARVPLIAQGEFGIPGRQAQHQRRLHRHRAPALLNRRGCARTCPASWNARSRATAWRPSAAPQLSNARREHLS